MRARRVLVVMVVVMVATIAAEGCNLFRIRDPEDPSGGTQVPWKIPVEPYLVLVNLKASTEARSITNFDREFTTDYKFRFDPFQVIGADTAWVRDRDISALTSLFQGKGPTTLAWTPTDSGSSGPDRFYRDLGYRLVIQRSPTDTSRAIMVGRCNLYLRQEGTNWMVRRWEDLQQGDATQTWGWARLNTSLPRD